MFRQWFPARHPSYRRSKPFLLTPTTFFFYTVPTPSACDDQLRSRWAFPLRNLPRELGLSLRIILRPQRSPVRPSYRVPVFFFAERRQLTDLPPFPLCVAGPLLLSFTSGAWTYSTLFLPFQIEWLIPASWSIQFRLRFRRFGELARPDLPRQRFL